MNDISTMNKIMEYMAPDHVVYWIALLLSGLTALISGVLGFRVVAGFLETGWPYTTTATAAVASGLVAFLALFHGVTLRILGRNDRRRESTFSSDRTAQQTRRT